MNSSSLSQPAATLLSEYALSRRASSRAHMLALIDDRPYLHDATAKKFARRSAFIRVDELR